MDAVGFKGHTKDGGSPAQQSIYIYGCSLLVIPNLKELNLIVNDQYRLSYEKELKKCAGRAYIGLPVSSIQTQILRCTK